MNKLMSEYDRYRVRAWRYYSDTDQYKERVRDTWQMDEDIDSYTIYVRDGVQKIQLDYTNSSFWIGTLTDDCFLMQCTGLKDRANNLIWEADLLQWDMPCTDVQGHKVFHRYAVQFGLWDNGESYDSYAGGYGWYLVDLGIWRDGVKDEVSSRHCRNTSIHYEYRELLVIGNIHENPELMV